LTACSDYCIDFQSPGAWSSLRRIEAFLLKPKKLKKRSLVEASTDSQLTLEKVDEKPVKQEEISAQGLSFGLSGTQEAFLADLSFTCKPATLNIVVGSVASVSQLSCFPSLAC